VCCYAQLLAGKHRSIFRFRLAASLRVAGQSLRRLGRCSLLPLPKSFLSQQSLPAAQPELLNSAKADVSCVVEKFHRKSLPLFMAGFCILLSWKHTCTELRLGIRYQSNQHLTVSSIGGFHNGVVLAFMGASAGVGPAATARPIYKGLGIYIKD
jgi:hypothetical protein